MRRSINSAPIAMRARVAEEVLTMLKTFTYPLMAALLVLVGCSKMDDNAPNNASVSCDLCHTTPLSQTAVHRIHLSNPAMANFPFHNTAASANYKIRVDTTDSTGIYKVDTAFHFSPTATVDNAARYQQNRVLNYNIRCADCHRGLNSLLTRNDDVTHRNGKKNASFDQEGLLAKHYNPRGLDTAHYTDTVPAAMTFDGTSCSNILCHGAGRKPLRNVTWNTTASINDTLSCTLCHNVPTTLTPPTHSYGLACINCHLDVTQDGGKTIHNFRKHLNDSINYSIKY